MVDRCKQCRFHQESKCILSRARPIRALPLIFCDTYIRTIVGINDNATYLNFVAARNNNVRAWMLSALSLIVAIMALFVTILKCV